MVEKYISCSMLMINSLNSEYSLLKAVYHVRSHISMLLFAFCLCLSMVIFGDGVNMFSVPTFMHISRSGEGEY